MNNKELFINGDKLPEPLSKQESFELIKKAQAGDNEAYDKLFIHNVRLVLNIVTHRFKFVETDPKDLVSVGNIGLMKAIQTFDTNKDKPFATYAAICIVNEILMYINKIKKHITNIDSLDNIIGIDNDGYEMVLSDSLCDSNNIETTYLKAEENKIIRKVINSLNERDKQIILLYFGFDNKKRLRHHEIAKIMNVSASRISKIMLRLLKTISLELQKQNIIEQNLAIPLANKTKIAKVNSKTQSH